MERTQEMSDQQQVAQAEERDEVAALREEILRLTEALEEAEARAREYLDGWQRERASFANYRRRIVQERESLSLAAYEEVICQFLPLLDDLERACQTAPQELKDHPWVDGLWMVLRKFEKTLENLGVEPIESEGAKFNPELHDAITHEQAEGYSEGDIIDTVTRGFRLGDRVLRCSVVRVAKDSES